MSGPTQKFDSAKRATKNRKVAEIEEQNQAFKELLDASMRLDTEGDANNTVLLRNCNTKPGKEKFRKSSRNPVTQI